MEVVLQTTNNLTKLSTTASKLAGPPLRRLFCGFTLRYRKSINTTPAGYNDVRHHKVKLTMKLIFFDETKSDNDYGHYHIGGVCIDEENLGKVENEINRVVENAFGHSKLVRGTELHAAEIYHRKSHFKEWKDFDKRIVLIDELMKILSIPELQLIDIQINVLKLHQNQVPDEVAFMFFCERANDLCKANSCLGMLIGDRESDRVSERYAVSLSGYRASGTEFAFGRDIKCLVDSVHFTHSHLSRFLQLADIYTWLLQFRNRNRNSENVRHKAIFDIWSRDDIQIFPSKYKEWPK